MRVTQASPRYSTMKVRIHSLFRANADVVRRHYAFPLLALAWLLAAAVDVKAAEPSGAPLDLSGTWEFLLGGPEPVFPQAAAAPALSPNDTIELPGTTETRGKGPENPGAERGMLTRVRKYDGPAWYRRSFEVPAAWAGRRLELLLERTRYTQVWLDGAACGEQRWATGPQRYALSASAKPGRHELVILVDNRAARRPYEADAHQYSDNTQTNWNGILGRIEVRALAETSLADVQVYPDLAHSSFRVEIATDRRGAEAIPGTITVSARSANHAGPAHEPLAVLRQVEIPSGQGAVSIPYLLGPEARTWDEFSPALYLVKVRLETKDGAVEKTIQTGLRELRIQGTQIAVNGRITFLRGKHDACVFPITGHPPTDVDGWVEYLSKLQSYGINHVRCHTWVPPEAAFAAADRLGIYLQPELPFWGTFDAKIRDALTPEGERVIREFGNHPSFAMMTLGNELGGDRAMMNALVEHLRSLDPRHLYADGSNNVLWDPDFQKTNDFWPTAKAKTPASGKKALPARGSYYQGDGYDGAVQWGDGSTRGDLRAATEGIPAPVIGHEIGQWTVYPDYSEIPRYTGVVAARNLEYFRSVMQKHGLLGQADAWFHASGALSASLYKEEIELALRTPGFGGFQLLDLQDFPGQGTALVGMLNAFMESKGLITVDAWREFCGPIVPLARFDRYTWTAGETYAADVEVAHYGRDDLRNALVAWSIVSPCGVAVAKGAFPAGTLARGGLRSVGHVSAVLPDLAQAERFDLLVTAEAGSQRYVNRWPLWVYPKAQDTGAPQGVSIVRSWTAARPLLLEGRAVLLIPEGKRLGYSVGGAYATDFWCWPMFSGSPGTMGLLVDAQSPALAGFPTRTYSERQWSAIAFASSPVVLTGTPAELRPQVQVVDNLARNDKLGLVFESRVGKGRLLVCAVDLYALQAKPEARQLLAGLVRYAGGADFHPAAEVPVATWDQRLRPSLAEGRGATASSFHQPPWGAVPKPECVDDGDINTRWTAKDGDTRPWVAVDLGGNHKVDTIELEWNTDEPGYRYLVEGSADGSVWTTLSDERENRRDSGRHFLVLPEPRKGIRHVRIVVTEAPGNTAVSLRELRVLGE
ncbi:hypothetical protein DB347_13035 [Opitutaceae bacterium EW11]|nr:hypothetical protein DB347_13035 [Opitutaceae bacterium EW11]